MQTFSANNTKILKDLSNPFLHWKFQSRNRLSADCRTSAVLAVRKDMEILLLKDLSFLIRIFYLILKNKKCQYVRRGWSKTQISGGLVPLNTQILGIDLWPFLRKNCL